VQTSRRVIFRKRGHTAQLEAVEATSTHFLVQAGTISIVLIWLASAGASGHSHRKITYPANNPSHCRCHPHGATIQIKLEWGDFD
jgi:hypothetical protein